MSKIKLRIIHGVSPKKYFPALFLFRHSGKDNTGRNHGYSVFKVWLSAWIREQKPFEVSQFLYTR